jgi:hypothetical protein
MAISVYTPLIAHLTASTGDRLVLTIDEIEAILGATLPRTAREKYGFWRGAAYRHVADMERAGWEATLHRPAQAVEFRRIAGEPGGG